MSYSINFILKDDYLHVRIEGENTAENVKRYLAEVQDLCLQHKCNKVLIEENLTGPTISTYNIFTIAEQGSRHISPDIHKIAYIDMNPEHNTEAMHFAETVAQNRGVNIRLFTDLQLAIEWIGSS